MLPLSHRVNAAKRLLRRPPRIRKPRPLLLLRQSGGDPWTLTAIDHCDFLYTPQEPSPQKGTKKEKKKHYIYSQNKKTVGLLNILLVQGDELV